MTRWLLLLALSVTGCAQHEPPLRQRESEPAAPRFEAHRSLMKVALRGPERVAAGDTVELEAEVEPFVGAPSFNLDLRLPDGVRLVSGAKSELVAEAGKVVRRFTVHIDRVPDGDVELDAKIRGTSFGVQGRSTYRFGRPEPRFAEPVRGKALRVGGRDVGQPIELHQAR